MIFLGEKNKFFNLDDYINNHCLLLQQYNNNIDNITKKKYNMDSYVNNYYDICTYKFKLKDIKSVAKKYKLRINGPKDLLLKRCYFYLLLSEKIIFIQKYIRGYLQRKINKLRGKALFKRTLCNNQEDFLSFESIPEISFKQFFSYEDENFTYGFNVISFHNLILKSKNINNILNPYNRKVISCDIISNFQKLLKLNKKFKLNMEIEIEKQEGLSLEKINELKIVEFFQKIDNLGHCTNPTWLMELSNYELYTFIQKLSDIWFYRIHIDIETKKKICPPLGNPFRNGHVSLYSNRNKNLSNVLFILNNFIHTDSDRESQALGCYYVLGALTLVSENAANSLNWLFQAFN